MGADYSDSGRMIDGIRINPLEMMGRMIPPMDGRDNLAGWRYRCRHPGPV